MKLLLLAMIALMGGTSYSQNLQQISYAIQEIPESQVASAGDIQIQTTQAKYFVINPSEISKQMVGVMHREDENSGFQAKISFPMPDGTLSSFRAMKNSTMSSELDTKYSEINSYDARGMDSPAFVKWDITPQGLHAMIMRPGLPTVYIDPAIMGNDQYYVVYSRNDFVFNEDIDCQTKTLLRKVGSKFQSEENTPESFGSCELHSYRLALSATGEYTQFHGGTVALAQAAQVTTMNRVNGVFEKDMAITMTIIPNNNLLIFTDGGTDPFTNGNPGNMINQNQTETDGTIGSANYDIGHVFGTNSGGLAGLGVVCSGGNKARGVTGSGAPIGDPFDIDYVAHEMGHQFGANHTQNNGCNRNNATAMEPGSASTIMGYAGICAPNVQNNSDDHFHGISLQEIGNEINQHTCEVLTPLANSAPVITGSNGNVFVPANTPFALTAFATDPDGDPLTYNWEQMNNNVSTQPPLPTSTAGPNFRSLSSTTNPTRYFPNLVDLANGGPFTWEVIPSVSRTMDFRCTLRDNAAGPGGCNDHIDVTVSTDAGSGPFIVQYPSVTGIVWNSLTSETVTWDVANTDVAPVSCANVNILLSIDGGLTYPITLATNVPNDGSELISVPNNPTTTARVMVICSSGTFFDISDNNFEIVGVSDDFVMSTTPSSDTICQPSNATYTVDIGVVGTFTDDVTLSISGLPAGVNGAFSVNPVSPVGSSTLTLSNTGAATPGVYTITVSGTSSTGTKNNTLEVTILPSSISAVTLLAPLNGASGEFLPVTLTWSALTGATYDIEIATDAGFTSIVEQASGLTTESYTATSLSAGTTYYWRVNTNTVCATSGFSSVFSFTTSSCSIYSSTDVPVAIPAPGTGTYTSTLTVSATGTIDDLNVASLFGSHNATGNLTFTLISPTGTSVVLMSGQCGNQNDFDIVFDDEAASAVIPCPPNNGNTYQPAGLLSAFDGEDPNGVWTLSIQDNANPNGGQLDGWSLEICTTPVVTCTDPTVPTLSFTPGSYCSGDMVTLNISGSLNDATSWSVYSGSCGGTLLGATSGTSFDIIVSGGTNDFFIRGEGGCVTPGSCGSTTINAGTPSSGSESITSCDSYTWSANSTTYTSTGVFTATLTNASGCDSTATLNLTINSSNSGSETVSACDSYTWSANSTTYSSTGVFTATLTNANGCDSTATLNLTINSSNTGTETVTTCNNYVWSANGTTYTNSGMFTTTLTNTAGCDSIVTLNLTITSFATGTDVITACGSHTWINGTTYSASNTTATHTIIGGSVNGCDSIVTLNLTINNATSGTDVITACDSYIWIDGITYTSSNNTATFTLANGSSNGCDSTVTLDLTINNSTSGTDVVTACDVYTWIDGTTYSSSNNTSMFTIAGGAANGCDSIVTLDLTINVSSSGMEFVTACNSYQWAANGSTYTTGGVYTATLANSSGCDSMATLDLTITTITTGTDIISACNSYTWIDGITYTSSNNTATYTLLGGSVNGCDSLVNLDLTITNVTTGTDIISACNSYTWIDGTTYTSSNNTATYTLLGGSINGCDSIVSLDLTINLPSTGTETAAVCESYVWPANGSTYSATGTYTTTLTNAAGCDSVVTLDLTVQGLPNVVLSLTASQFCETDVNVSLAGGFPAGGTYSGTGITGGVFSPSTTGPGTFDVVYEYTDANGCTSTDLDSITVQDCSGIDEQFEQSVTLYPNPTENVILISWEGEVEYIEITDTKGKLISTYTQLNTSIQVDMSSYSPGVYFVQVHGTQGHVVKDVIKY